MERTRSFFRQNQHLLILALAFTLLHTAFNGQYGFHRDELDILMNARQLDWGYVAYPPFTPLVARAGLTLFGNNLMLLRLASAIAAGIAVLLVGLMARDMGARRPAQIFAAIAAGIAPVALTSGTLLQYMAFDYLWWVVISFCFVRLLACEDPRWWLGIGAGIGMAMMTKYTAAFFVAGWAAAVLLTANRRYLRSGWLWAGAGLALLIFLPNLIWQIRHDFISLDFLSAIHARDIQWGRTDAFLPEQLIVSTHPFTLPIWAAGLGLCLFAPGFKRFRPLGIAFLVTFAILFLARGRAYYTGPAYAMLIAAGTAGWERWLMVWPARIAHPLAGLGAALLPVGALLMIVLVKPVAPVGSDLWAFSSDINHEVVEMVGWDDLTAQVAEIYQRLPEDQKPRTVILAGNYGEAGALDLYGPDYGLPRVISGANSLWARGYGTPAPETVIVVGFERAYASNYFQLCDNAGFVRNRYGVKNEETTRHTGLYICRQPRKPWSEMWASMQWFQ